MDAECDKLVDRLVKASEEVANAESALGYYLLPKVNAMKDAKDWYGIERLIDSLPNEAIILKAMFRGVINKYGD